jgi:NAD(P)H-nitrite reductase large subunit
MIANKARPTLVVVGSGMAGARFVHEVLSRDKNRFNIRMFGAEPHGTYNRILLSNVLGGFQDPNQLWIYPREWYEENGIHLHAGVRAERFDLENKTVIGADGKVVEPYDKLVLATGSRPFVPPIEGSKKAGVWVFRTLEDCGRIAAHAQEAERAVVIGGGLLGLEAARGLLSHELDVTVVEMAPHLMPQQLDPTGGELLRQKLADMGLRVLLNTRTAEILGNERVTGVRFADGTVIETDMVVISCGITPNVEEARAAGLKVERAVVVDDQLHTSAQGVFAVGECAQHRGRVYGLVDPIYEQARVLADVITEKSAMATYVGSRLATSLKVMGIDLVSMGEVSNTQTDSQVLTWMAPERGIYKKVVVRDNKLVGAVLLGINDPLGRLLRLFKSGESIPGSALDLLGEADARDALLEDAGGLSKLPDETQICNCNTVSKGTILQAIKDGKRTVSAIGECTKAGTGCGTCQPLLAQLIEQVQGGGKPPPKNKIELMKDKKCGLDVLPELEPLMPNNRWQEVTEEQQQLAKWHGLFFRKTTPGNHMLRLRLNSGQLHARQVRVIADLSDEFGKGFCDLTTRQQIQLRWFTLAEISEIWRRLADVGLGSKQTGLDNIRGVCGCPAAGWTAHELFDATPVVEEYTNLFLDNREFTNLPRKFNVTITGCLENCCHTETQDIALVPAQRDLDGWRVNGFNVFVGGKQGSGGYTPAVPLDVFARPEEAAEICADLTRIFRDHGSRAARNRARLSFLVHDRGVAWMRAELERRYPRSLPRAGTDLRKKHHVDHLGIHPQKKPTDGSEQLYYLGMLVPVGRIETKLLRGVADLAERYGNGEVRVTVGQNLLIGNIREGRLGSLMDEPLFKELPYDPSPIMRGLVSCTGTDYCAMALVDTKKYAVDVARELEKRTAGRTIKPLSIHWSGCPAGCGLHQVATIGLQGCRSRVNGEVVDAAHVCTDGRSGPQPKVATDLMYDVPITQLADALEPLVRYLPRS